MALAGMGLGAASPVSKAKDSSRRALAARAPSTSPLANDATISACRAPLQWAATLTTPEAPTARRGRFRPSSPL